MSAATQPSLNAFRAPAKEAEWLYLSQDSGGWKVLARGSTPDRRNVAWVEPECDTESAFIAALGQAFSRGIQESVVRELGLGPRPGQPLSSRVVEQAIAMAEASRPAMLGVDFMTQLMHSAQAQSAGFATACMAQGVDAAAVSAPLRESIDAAMGRRFSEAAHQGHSPVDFAQAQQWLQAELAPAIARAPDVR